MVHAQSRQNESQHNCYFCEEKESMLRIMLLLVVIISLLTSCIQTVNQKVTAKPKNEHIEILSVDISPNSIKRGKEITISVRYMIRDGIDSGTLVNERMSILRENREISVIRENKSIVKNGKWENYLTLGIPANLFKGKYEIKVQLSTDYSATECNAGLVVN